MYDLLSNTKRELFHGRGPYHIETNPLICSANQRTGFYMIGSFVIKELRGLNPENLSAHSK